MSEKISWIPTEFAVQGKYIKLDDKVSDDESPTVVIASTDGWLVSDVYATEESDHGILPGKYSDFCCQQSSVPVVSSSKKRSRRR